MKISGAPQHVRSPQRGGSTIHAGEHHNVGEHYTREGAPYNV